MEHSRNMSRTVPKRKRALIVNASGLRWPSAMVRALQYQPLFEQSPSWHADYTTIHSELLSGLLYDRHRLRWQYLIETFRRPLTAYAARLHRKNEDEIVKRAADADLVSIVKASNLQLVRRLCRLGRPRVIVDINDAVWLPYHRSGGWGDLDLILAEVHGVVCENDHVANYARRHNKTVFVVPDAPQVEVFDRFRGLVQRNPQQITLGWIGGAQNIGPLYRILEPLEALFAKHPQLQLRVVGASERNLPQFESVRFSCRSSYRQEEMVREVLNFDIGLFPLFHNEDGRARGTLKAMVYMSGEAVAVCENFGENPGLIQDGCNGVLASSPEQWYEKLEWLINHPEERRAIATRGLQTIRSRFTAERVFTKLVNAYDQVCEGG